MKAGKQTRTVTDKGAHAELPASPELWTGSDGWKMPSGRGLAEFALAAGFIAPLVWKDEGGEGESSLFPAFALESEREG